MSSGETQSYRDCQEKLDVAAVLYVDPVLVGRICGYLAAVLYQFCVCHYSCFVLTEDSITRQTVYTSSVA